MDTELKKYKSDFFKRLIAVVICLLCISGMTSQVITSVDEAERDGLVYVNFTDALRYKILEVECEKWDYTTFRNGYTTLLSQLSTKMNRYGNGTEKDYNKRLREYEKILDNETEFYADRVIYGATNSFYDFYYLYNLGIIEITGVYVLDSMEDTESDEHYSFDEEASFYYSEYRNMEGAVKEPVLPVSVSEEFKNIEYDNVYYTEDTKVIDDDFGEPIKKISPGYYAFKVNKDILRERLVIDNAVESFYSSYEKFYEDYLENEKVIKEHAGTARYFIRDRKGNVITNISSLTAESKTDEIKEVFSSFGIYSFNSNDEIYLSNGKYYSDTYTDWLVSQEREYAREETTEPTTSVTATEMTIVVVPTTTPAEEAYDEKGGYFYTVPQTTRANASAVTEIPVTNSYYELYIGFDEEAEYESCHFASLEANIEAAAKHITDCAFVCGILGTVLIICFIYLIIITGKKKGSEKVHLYRIDNIFPEIRIVIDGGLGFLCGLAFIYLFELYIESQNTVLVGGLLVLSLCGVFLLLLDLVLYLARHIKNRSLLKNIFIVWLCRKSVGHIKEIKGFVNEKLLYTRDLNKTVIIRTAIMIGINIVVGITAFVCALNYNFDVSALFIIVLFLFDLFIIYRGIRFVGGVDKLFSAVKEMHEGNTDINIEKNALPGYLYLPAENLQCLSEGIKAAVDEAVRQEKAKTELITNVSHDLKTPLTSIINYVDLMKKCDISDETALSYLQVLSEKSDRLKVLIEDLVEASKASAGVLSVDFVCVSCRELVNQILGEVEESFTEKNLNVVLNIPENDVKIKADSKHIYRVLENLFINVKKYALESTRVYITVSERNGKGVINIKNISAAPLNISADELKERFVRGEQSRSTEGNGLGLSIAENLCTLQNGSLNIEIIGDLFSVTVEMEKFR